MLALAGARVVLSAERERLRRALRAVLQTLDEAARPGHRDTLRHRVQTCRRLAPMPRTRGSALFEALRGRSPALARIERACVRDATVLDRALALLDAAAADERAAIECAVLLRAYGRRKLRELDEEAMLLIDASRLLSRDEWSRIASSMSAQLYPPNVRETARTAATTRNAFEQAV